jgi:CheY-like chemotaxis protein
MKSKVFIVDDDPKLLNYLDLKLTKGGFEVERYKDGEEVMSVIDENKPDIILCDVVMPEMDGFELLQKIRGNPETATIPFIFISARNDMSEQLEGLRLGADDYLTKPLMIDLLIERMKRVLGQKEVDQRQALEADFHGSLSQMNMNDIMQIIEGNQKTGELLLFTSENNVIGKVFFRNGNLLDAKLDELEGVEAFYGLLEKEAGYFGFFSKPIDIPDKIPTGNMEAILKGFRLVEKSKILFQRFPDLEVRMKIQTSKIKTRPESGADKEKLLKLFSLVKEKRTIGEILDSGQLSRPTVAALIVEMLDGGVLSVLEKKGEKKAEKPSEPSYPIEKWLEKMLWNLNRDQITGMLEIKDRRAKSAIFFQDGYIVHAFHGRVTAKKALYRIFYDRGGAPNFLHQAFVLTKTIKEDLDFLLEEGQREIEAMNRLSSDELDKNLLINIRILEKTPKIKDNPVMKNIITLIQQFEKVRFVIDASRLTDHQSYSHIQYLIKNDVVTSV